MIEIATNNEQGQTELVPIPSQYTIDIFDDAGNAIFPKNVKVENSITTKNLVVTSDIIDGSTRNNLMTGGLLPDQNIKNIPCQTGNYGLDNTGWTGSAHVLHSGSSNSDIAFVRYGGAERAGQVHLCITYDSEPSRWVDLGVITTH